MYSERFKITEFILIDLVINIFVVYLFRSAANAQAAL